MRANRTWFPINTAVTAVCAKIVGRVQGKYKSSDALDAETTPGLNVRNDSDAIAKVWKDPESCKEDVNNLQERGKKGSKEPEKGVVVSVGGFSNAKEQ